MSFVYYWSKIGTGQSFNYTPRDFFCGVTAARALVSVCLLFFTDELTVQHTIVVSHD